MKITRVSTAAMLLALEGLAEISALSAGRQLTSDPRSFSARQVQALRRILRGETPRGELARLCRAWGRSYRSVNLILHYARHRGEPKYWGHVP